MEIKQAIDKADKIVSRVLRREDMLPYDLDGDDLTLLVAAGVLAGAGRSVPDQSIRDMLDAESLRNLTEEQGKKMREAKKNVAAIDRAIVSGSIRLGLPEG